MKNQIHLLSRSEVRQGDARSNIGHRHDPWPGLLLAGCCAMVVGLNWSARAAVTEAWVQRYSNVVSNANDQAFKVLSDVAGDMIVTGVSHDGSTGNDFLMIRYSGADGSVLWQKRLSDPDTAVAVAVDGSRNVVVARASDTTKYRADGTGVWTNSSGATALAVDVSGNVVVTGFSGGDYYTAKYAAADGTLLWEKRSTNSTQILVVDSSGSVVVSGSSVRWLGRPGFGSMIIDYYTAKYAASDGALLWEKRRSGPVNDSDHLGAVAVDGSGNVVVLGPSSNATNYGVYTTKYAGADGALLWERPYSGASTNRGHAQAVAMDSDGNVVVAGYSFHGSDYNAVDYYTAKYAAADGALLWEKRYNGSANKEDSMAFNSVFYDEAFSSRNLAIGPNGVVAVTGSSGWVYSGIAYNYATVLYREGLSPLSIERVPSGVRLRFAGVAGRSYAVERALAVTGPWSTIDTPAALIDGIIEYVDINPPSGTAFDRTSTP